MNELRKEQKQNSDPGGDRGRILPVRVSPTEVRYMTEEEFRNSLSDEDVQRGLALAGSWSGLHLTEEELFRRLSEIRYGRTTATLAGYQD